MKIAKFIFSSLTNPERSTFVAAFTIFFVAIIVKAAVVVDMNSIFVPVEGGYYCEGIIGQPTAINPIISDNSFTLMNSFSILSLLFPIYSKYYTYYSVIARKKFISLIFYNL